MQISDKFTPYARRRAWRVVTGFALWGFLATWGLVTDWRQSGPLVVFYARLLLNSFFSIRAFASITPLRQVGQQCWDMMLALCFVLLPLSFNLPLNFILIAALLFVVATLKYVFLIPLVGFSQLLYAKIRIDTLGILLCICTLAGALWGYPKLSSILLGMIFLIANVYVLWWRPLYRLETHYEPSSDVNRLTRSGIHAAAIR